MKLWPIKHKSLKYDCGFQCGAPKTLIRQRLVALSSIYMRVQGYFCHVFGGFHMRSYVISYVPYLSFSFFEFTAYRPQNAHVTFCRFEETE